ncbi:MAG TPA: formate dehydrogenase accessory sulfurtransferase FdhD [Mucilaginibacter sp.]|jgi:FdhD protein
MTESSVKYVPLTKVTDSENEETSDALAVEEPLEIQLGYGLREERKVQSIAVTMRTPGHDAELACGFLFTEGIVKHYKDIGHVAHHFIDCAENRENVIQVSLASDIIPNLKNAERNFYTTSSCGVCGKGSINAIRTVGTFTQTKNDDLKIEAELLYRLPDILRKRQAVFADTGGLHASALFDKDGKLLIVREDVGRHNALDKLIGAALKKNWLPLDKCILLLSGRASFELVQKAAMANINIIASVGAPSSLAVQLAEEFNITLAGFLRDKRFNIYTAAHRILLPIHENTY